MKGSKLFAIVAMVALFAFSFACGDDDGGAPQGNGSNGNGSEEGGSSEIRTARGDGVQALVAEFSGSGSGGGISAGASGVGGDSFSGSIPQTGAGGPASGGGSALSFGGQAQGDSASGGDALQQDGSGGITVQGYGSAEQDADGAILEFQFNRNGNYNYSPPPAPAPSPITEADLQAVIDALVGAGVPRDSIEIPSNSTYYYDYYSPIFLRATLDNLDVLPAAAAAGRSAATGISGLSFQNVTVMYTVEDCTSLRAAALDEAVADANERGDLLAGALDVGFGPVSAASDYSWWGYGSGNCGQQDNYYWGYYGSGVTYVEGQPQEVQVFESISVTYAIQ